MRYKQGIFNGHAVSYPAGYGTVRDYVETLQLNVSIARNLIARGHRHAAAYRISSERNVATLQALGVNIK